MNSYENVNLNKSYTYLQGHDYYSYGLRTYVVIIIYYLNIYKLINHLKNINYYKCDLGRSYTRELLKNVIKN